MFIAGTMVTYYMIQTVWRGHACFLIIILLIIYMYNCMFVAWTRLAQWQFLSQYPVADLGFCQGGGPGCQNLDLSPKGGGGRPKFSKIRYKHFPHPPPLYRSLIPAARAPLGTCAGPCYSSDGTRTPYIGATLFPGVFPLLTNNYRGADPPPPLR